jgi:hypothetical protein
MKPIACWHHGDLDRLLDHLRKSRIDLYGRNEKTEIRRKPRADNWWNSRMRLKLGDRIRIVVGGKIIAYATIKNTPKDLPPNEVEGIWGTFVELKQIKRLTEPYPIASCKGHCQGSHRFDGPKTRLLEHDDI